VFLACALFGKNRLADSLPNRAQLRQQHAIDFFIHRILKGTRQAPSRKKHVSRHAKVPRQRPHLIERQFAFAAQNHHPQAAAGVQNARQIRRALSVLFQQVLERVQTTGFWPADSALT
jgi:hypothetical protein